MMNGHFFLSATCFYAPLSRTRLFLCVSARTPNLVRSRELRAWSYEGAHFASAFRTRLKIFSLSMAMFARRPSNICSAVDTSVDTKWTHVLRSDWSAEVKKAGISFGCSLLMSH